METIVCNGIAKSYGKKQVLKDINLTLEKGKIYGLIGRNGAGKTTLLSIMSAQNPASEGKLTEIGLFFGGKITPQGIVAALIVLAIIVAGITWKILRKQRVTA